MGHKDHLTVRSASTEELLEAAIKKTHGHPWAEIVLTYVLRRLKREALGIAA